MNAFRMFKYLASVVAIVFTLVFAIEGKAETAITALPPTDYVAAACNEARSKANTAHSDFQRTCGEAKLRLTDPKGCRDRITSCQEGYDKMEDEDEESGSGMSAILGAMGMGAQIAQTYAEKGCPDMTASEGREKERDLKTDIKDREREINDTKKDITELQKKTAEQFNEINKKIAEADADYKELQSKMSEEEIAAEAESRKALSDAAQSLRDIQKDILTKEKQLAESILNKAMEMSKFTDFVIKNQCAAKIREEVRKQAEANKKKSSSQSLAKINAMIKNDAKQGYTECVQTLVESRNKVRLQFDNAIKTIEEDLGMARQSLSEAQNSLKELQANIEKAKQVAVQRKNDALANYQQTRANLAQELQLLSQNSAAESKQLEAKLMQLNMDLNTLKQDQNNFLASGRGGTKTLDDVLGAYNMALSADKQAVEACKDKQPYTSPFATE